jgi:hypothetical protein|tara:strand:- start:296 stop:475 length:180 start_codon:yes stop_codon:yes gene_type:complete
MRSALIIYHPARLADALGYLFKTTQMENAMTSSAADIKERAKTMIPMIERARQLGIDLT